MDFDFEIAEAVEAGLLFGCPECHEVSEGVSCETCHDGACTICGALIAKGDAGDRDGTDVFCKTCVAETAEPRSGFVQLAVAVAAAKPFPIGQKVKVLPPRSPNSPADEYTDQVVYVTAVYGVVGPLDYAVAHDQGDHFDFIITGARLVAVRS